MGAIIPAKYGETNEKKLGLGGSGDVVYTWLGLAQSVRNTFTILNPIKLKNKVEINCSSFLVFFYKLDKI